MSFDLRELRAEMMREETRKLKAEADTAELRHVQALEIEVDRQIERERKVNFFGEIDRRDAGALITQLERWETRDPGEPIEITLYSGGGQMASGFAIYDTIQRLRRKGHKVTTRATGMAASMAAVVLQAGDERVMDKSALLMLHSPSLMLFGSLTADEMDDQKQLIEKQHDAVIAILTSERTKLTQRTYRARTKRKDLWLTADEALELGLIDRID